jgi:hypothetical protein
VREKPYPPGNWSVTTSKSPICMLFVTGFRIGRGARPDRLGARLGPRQSAQRMVSVLRASPACRAMSESASFGTELAAMIKDPSSSLTNSAVTVS